MDGPITHKLLNECKPVSKVVKLRGSCPKFCSIGMSGKTAIYFSEAVSSFVTVNASRSLLQPGFTLLSVVQLQLQSSTVFVLHCTSSLSGRKRSVHTLYTVFGMSARDSWLLLQSETVSRASSADMFRLRDTDLFEPSISQYNWMSSIASTVLSLWRDSRVKGARGKSCNITFPGTVTFHSSVK